MTTNRKIATLGLAALVMGTTACGADMDPLTVRQSISSNTANVSQRVAESITFLENSNLFARGLESLGGDECAASVEGSGADFDSAECDTSYEFQTADLEEASAQLAQILEERIFVDANIESEDGDKITYLLRGNVICADGPEIDAECADGFNQAKVRLVVTSPSDGDIDVDVLLGDARAKPLTLEFHEDSLAATVRLQGIKAAIEHFGVLEGESPDLPDTMKGAVRVELATSSATRATATLSVLEAIELSNDDWSFNIAKADPVVQVTADAGTEKIEAIVNLGRVQALFPTEEWTYDESTGVESSVTHHIALDLGGITGATILEAATDTLNLTNLGLGQTTTTLAVNGKEVLALDLNANDGRAFNASVTAADENFELSVAPAFDLKAVLSFIDAPHMSVDDWMLEETLTIRAEGARMRSNDSGMELVEGTLAIALQNAGIQLDAAAGQCLLDGDGGDVLTPCADGEVCEPQPVETSNNPFDSLDVGACVAP